MNIQRLTFAAVSLATAFAVPAQAAVTYQFEAFSSFPFSGEEIIPDSGFVVTVADFITSPTVIPVGDLTSCSVTTTAEVGACRQQEFLFDIADDFDTISFGIMTTLNQQTGVFYYFDEGAFGAEGVYESGLLGTQQAGRLTVTVDGGPIVPEPATWALMMLGFSAVGGSLRNRKKATVRYAF